MEAAIGKEHIFSEQPKETPHSSVPCRVGEELEVTVNGLGEAGEGIGRAKGFAVFVPGALPGELVKARVRLVKKSYAVGELLTVLKPSLDRVAPPCRFFGRCGGCQLQHLDYHAQLRAKRIKVADALERIAGLPEPHVLPTLASAYVWQYRNKMLLPVGGAPGAATIGCYARSSHDVVDAPDCFIQDNANNQLSAAVREWLNKYGVPPYNEATGKGLIRHVMGRVGGGTGEVMAVLVTAGKAVPHLDELLCLLRGRVPKLASVVQIVKKGGDNRVLAGQEYVLWGKKQIASRLNGFFFEISASSFFQVNSLQAAALYLAAVEMAGLTGRELVMEACSGTGSGSLFIARKARALTGIEISAVAVADAEANARLNGFTNIRFITGDIAVELPRLAGLGFCPDVLFADPPRAGLGKGAILGIAKLAPRTIIYISCNPASLSRDIAMLGEFYRAVEFLPVDMFPMTAHVECIARLEIIRS